MTTIKSRNLLLHACPRCHGDLLHDAQDDEFVCIQCGRRADPAVVAQLVATRAQNTPKLPVAA
jgi:hypothetical protein